jgi:hypothetical protein
MALIRQVVLKIKSQERLSTLCLNALHEKHEDKTC